MPIPSKFSSDTFPAVTPSENTSGSLDARPARQRVLTAKGADYAAELINETNPKKKRKPSKKQPQVPKKVGAPVADISNVARPPNPLAASLITKFVAPDEDPYEDEPSVPQTEPARPLATISNQTPFCTLTTGADFHSRQTALSKARAAAHKPKRVPTSVQKTSVIPVPRPIVSSPALQQDATTPLAQNNSVSDVATLPSNEPEDPSQESTKVSHTRHRPRMMDLSDEHQGLFKYAVADYRSILSTHCPFPDATEENMMALAALRRSSEALTIPMPDAAVQRTLVLLIIARDSQLRGELRTKTIPLVGSHYGFNGSCSPKCVEENKLLYTSLKAGDCFLFKAPSSCHGLFEHPIFQEVLNAVWFRDARDEGIKFESYFTPIPLQTLALIFTGVEYVLDHWSSGVFRNINQFTAVAYWPIYQKHLNTLESVMRYSATAQERLRRIRTRMLQRARRNAGLIAAQPLPVFNEEYIARFEQGDEDEDTDGDSENLNQTANNGHSGEQDKTALRKRPLSYRMKANKANKRPKIMSDAESKGHGEEDESDVESDIESDVEDDSEGGGENDSEDGNEDEGEDRYGDAEFINYAVEYDGGY